MLAPNKNKRCANNEADGRWLVATEFIHIQTLFANELGKLQEKVILMMFKNFSQVRTHSDCQEPEYRSVRVGGVADILLFVFLTCTFPLE